MVLKSYRTLHTHGAAVLLFCRVEEAESGERRESASLPFGAPSERRSRAGAHTFFSRASVERCALPRSDVVVPPRDLVCCLRRRPCCVSSEERGLPASFPPSRRVRTRGVTTATGLRSELWMSEFRDPRASH